MAGLMNPTGGDDGGDDGDTPNVTPEEQAAYETFVKAGFNLIYGGGKVRPSILKLLDDDPKDLMQVLTQADELKQFSPTVALAATAVVVTLEVVRRSGNDKPDDAVILHGGQALLEDLAEVAEKAGIHTYSQQELNQAMLMGADIYREAASAEGLIDEDALKQEFAEMQQAGKEGRIGDLIPQFRDPQQGQGGGAPAPEPDQDTAQQDQSQDPATNPDAPDDEEQQP